MLMLPFFALSQVAPDSLESFTVSLEFRPRTEFRNGYRHLRSDTTKAAFFTENRSRIYVNYTRDRFAFHTSFQDVRVWGEADPRSTNGSVQIFETYVEPSITPQLKVRIGKQKIMYDNQRLFAQNDWRQNGGTHDGLRFMYENGSFEADLIGAFNQPKGAQDRFFGTTYYPGFSYYKILLVNFLKHSGKNGLTLTAINATDAFQDPDIATKSNWRFTSGGRVEKVSGDWYFTLAGYYQYGQTPSGNRLSAFYYQPEIRYKSNAWTLRLGAEVFSGGDDLNPDGKSHSFDALYGVNHRFLGSMDFFTRFPGDLNDAGLKAPYFFVWYDIRKHITLRSDHHLFFTQNNFVEAGNTEPISPFLAYENDWLLRVKANGYTEIDLGFSYALTTESLEVIKNGGNHELFQSWAYAMVTFKPELFNWTR